MAVVELTSEQGILKSKNSKTGVRPNMALDESTRAIQDLDSLRLRNKNVKNAKLLDQQRVKPEEEYKTICLSMPKRQTRHPTAVTTCR